MTNKNHRTIILEWAAILTIIFSLAGLINQYLLLSAFNLSFADYADIDDFLVASINLIGILTSDNTALLISLAPLILSYLYPILLSSSKLLSFFSYFNKRNKVSKDKIFEDDRLYLIENEKVIGVKKTKKYINRYLNDPNIRLFLFILLTLLYLSDYIATKQIQRIKNGLLCSVKVEINTVGKNLKMNFSTSNLYPITGLNSAHFFYEIDNVTKEGAVHVISTSNISFTSSICTN